MKQKLCKREWGASASFNISSLLTHGREGPWRLVGPPPGSGCGIAGVRRVSSFFDAKPSKSNKRKSDAKSKSDASVIKEGDVAVKEDDEPVIKRAMEHVGCKGVPHTELSTVKYPQGFDMITNYPYSIHVPKIQLAWSLSNFIPRNIT